MKNIKEDEQLAVFEIDENLFQLKYYERFDHKKLNPKKQNNQENKKLQLFLKRNLKK